MFDLIVKSELSLMVKSEIICSWDNSKTNEMNLGPVMYRLAETHGKSF